MNNRDFVPVKRMRRDIAGRDGGNVRGDIVSFMGVICGLVAVALLTDLLLSQILG